MRQSLPDPPDLLTATAAEIMSALDYARATLSERVEPDQVRRVVRRLRELQRNIRESFPDLPLPPAAPRQRYSPETRLMTRRIKLLAQITHILPEPVRMKLPIMQQKLLDLQLREQLQIELSNLQAMTLALRTQEAGKVWGLFLRGRPGPECLPN